MSWSSRARLTVTFGALAAAAVAALPGHAGVAHAASANAIDVYAYTDVSNPASKIAQLPAAVDGVSWTVGWDKVEPSPGVYDW